MSFRTDLLPCLDDIQSIAGPDCLDIRTNRVFIVQRQFSSGNLDLGTGQDCETEILPRPMVRERNRGRELVVKPVPQKFVDIAVGGGTTRSGGFDADNLNPADVQRQVIVFRVEGPNAGEYTLADYSASRPFRQVMILKRIAGQTGLRLAHPQPQGTSDDAF
jgi:hypothetical protein